MSRWLGIDHGTKRIGVAVGGAGVGVATPLEQFSAEAADLAERISRLAEEYDAVGVVVGYPLRNDGSEGPQARLARRFAADLAEQTGLDVRLWDERLSSFAADERLKGEFTRKQKKRRHDAIAATVILEDFLTADGPASAPQVKDLGRQENGHVNSND